MLLDSNILIYAAEPGYDEVREFITKHETAVSVISKIEVLGYHKLNRDNCQKLESIFQILPVLPLSDPIIDKAISLRQTQKTSLGDALIAATALIHELTVVTANTKDFNWIDGLEIINPVAKG
ncbi:MAG: type II toxin-antitoxin system VapC family toxin [Chloroflexi bacterium]|nr:type II toxin-antitoxin system VapC family toxin [Chloroflexota bacterium]